MNKTYIAKEEHSTSLCLPVFEFYTQSGVLTFTNIYDILNNFKNNEIHIQLRPAGIQVMIMHKKIWKKQFLEKS